MHKEKKLIEIPLAGLEQGTHEFDFTCAPIDFKDLQLTEAGFTGMINVRAMVEKSEREARVTVETSATADFTCDICLSPASKALAGSYRIYYVFGEHPEAVQSAEEDYRIIESNATTLDISEDVRETLLLSIPMKVTCSDNPECRLYRSDDADEIADDEEATSWQESLGKLKNKYC
ncbi:MAG: DUF177 domain-containing protein [Chlorobiaceae bacterium]|nr:DUF177 domain-containing protein [Chlorobiaceae bacterium]